MNRLDTLFASKKNLLSIYATAGFPALTDTIPLCRAIQGGGADMIEIGFPYSDPIADGPVIQQASEKSLKNGMTLPLLFSQLEELRKEVSTPALLMGYLNPVLQYGIEKFADSCVSAGIDGVIIPDLPLEEFRDKYRTIFTARGLHLILFVSPTTSDERIREVDALSTSFIYAVSSPAVTGGVIKIDNAKEDYFRRLEALKLKHPIMIGFGIASSDAFRKACVHTHGAIVGSAFIKAIENNGIAPARVADFIRSIKG